MSKDAGISVASPSWVEVGPVDSEVAIASEVEKCSALLHGARVDFGGDLRAWVGECWERSARTRALFGGGWRWSWVGEVEGSISSEVVRDEWSRALSGAGRSTASRFQVAGPDLIVSGRRQWESWGQVIVRPWYETFGAKLAPALSPVLEVEPVAQSVPVYVPSSVQARAELQAFASDFSEFGEKWEAIVGAVGSSGVEVGARVSRAFLRALGRLAPHFVEGSELENVGALFTERMGQVWAGGRGRWRVVFSCAPSTFFRLGEWGENCCFKWLTAYGNSKSILPGIPGAVVGLVYKGVEDSVGAGPVSVLKGKPSGRAWGFLSPPDYGPGATLSNHYLLTRENTQAAFIEAFRALYNVKGGSLGAGLTGEYGTPVPTGNSYVNGDGWSWGCDGFDALRDSLQDHRREFGELSPACCDGERYPLLTGAGPVEDEDDDYCTCAVCDWRGEYDNFEGCDDCGHTVCTDCCGYDEIADRRICTDCGQVAPCSGCDRWGTLDENLTSCAGCDSSICDRCGVNCDDCGDAHCSGCVDYVEAREGSLCSGCLELHENEVATLAEIHGEVAEVLAIN